MRSASGVVYSDGVFAEGSICISKGKFRISTQTDSGADVKGIILPKTVNCHTHLGDAFIPRPAECSVEELVAPPNGLKHRMLRRVKEKDQVDAMAKAVSAIEASGTSHFIDFRESGLEGARRLLMASLGANVRPVILGRPESDGVDEISALLSVCDGLGFSAISDMDEAILAGMAEHARSQEKAFALHASEAKREDIGRILDLKPDLLVHMIHATDEDMETCAEAGIPVAVCPTANSFFGLVPPVRRMLDAGIRVCLGTDNAMLAPPSVLSEAAALRKTFPREVLADEDIMRMAFDEGRKVLNSLPGLGDEEQRDFFVLESPIDDPFKSIVGAGAGDIRLFDRSVRP